MCQFFSALYTRPNGNKPGELLWHWATDSHTDIMAIHKIKEAREGNFVRVEFTPPTPDKVTDIKAWNFRLDEERTPSWFDADEQESCIEKLRRLVAKFIVTDEREVLVDGPWVLAKEAKINRLISARVKLMCGSSNVGTMYGSSNVPAGASIAKDSRVK